MPTGGGFVFDALAETKRLDERFRAEFSESVSERSGVVYMLPLSAKMGPNESYVVEPLFVSSYSTKRGEVVSRRRYVGYSLRQKDAPPIDLSEKPEPTATGDARE